MKISNSFPLLLALGLLLAVVIDVVIGSVPHVPRTPEEIHAKLQSDNAGYYYLEAETMARQLLADPGANWTQCFLDQGTMSTPAGHGVWHAGGRVQVLKNNLPMVYPWEVWYSIESHAPLFIAAGPRHSGDLAAAMRAAGLPPAH